MPNLDATQLPPPTNWQDFETLCHILWRDIWRDSNAKKHGRNGQPQCGIDVYGNPRTGSGLVGIQCKGKDNFANQVLADKELRAEVDKAHEFAPQLSSFIVATVSQRDVNLQALARQVSLEQEEEGLFPIDIWFWEDIREELGRRPNVLRAVYPQLISHDGYRGALTAGIAGAAMGALAGYTSSATGQRHFRFLAPRTRNLNVQSEKSYLLTIAPPDGGPNSVTAFIDAGIHQSVFGTELADWFGVDGNRGSVGVCLRNIDENGKCIEHKAIPVTVVVSERVNPNYAQLGFDDMKQHFVIEVRDATLELVPRDMEKCYRYTLAAPVAP